MQQVVALAIALSGATARRRAQCDSAIPKLLHRVYNRRRFTSFRTNDADPRVFARLICLKARVRSSVVRRPFLGLSSNRRARVLLRLSCVELPPGRRSRVPISAFISRGRDRPRSRTHSKTAGPFDVAIISLMQTQKLQQAQQPSRSLRASVHTRFTRVRQSRSDEGPVPEETSTYSYTVSSNKRRERFLRHCLVPEACMPLRRAGDDIPEEEETAFPRARSAGIRRSAAT